MAKRYLTLDIGASAVKLAEFEGGKGGLTLVNYGIAALAAPLDAGNAGALLSPALLDIVREKGIKPGPVAISISGQMVFPRFASIAAAGGAEKFDQMIRFEIEQNIPFPIDEMICDRQVLGDNENGEKNVMIVAAKTDQVEDIAAAVRGAGFTPELVDVAPIAITNVLRYSGVAETNAAFFSTLAPRRRRSLLPTATSSTTVRSRSRATRLPRRLPPRSAARPKRPRRTSARRRMSRSAASWRMKTRRATASPRCAAP